MHQHHDADGPARNAAITRQYARVWKSIIDGVVPVHDADIAGWYGAAQHALGAALHAAEIERIMSCAGDEHEGRRDAA